MYHVQYYSPPVEQMWVFVINHNLLQKDGCLVRGERCINLWYKDKNTVGRLFLCLFNIRFSSRAFDVVNKVCFGLVCFSLVLAPLMVPGVSSDLQNGL